MNEQGNNWAKHLEEYKLTQDAFYKNEQSYLQFTSIMIAGVFVLVGGAVASKSKPIIVLAIIIAGFMLLCLLLHFLAVSGVSKVRAKRLEELEQTLNFEQHRRVHNYVETGSWIRRRILRTTTIIFLFVSVATIALLIILFALCADWFYLK